MQYLLLIYSEESEPDSQPSEAAMEVLERWRLVTEEMKSAGVWLGGEALDPVSSASTVRLRDGKTMITDGPFAETKEQLGGFYLIEVENADDALAWAGKLPAAEYGSIEVRPVMHFPQDSGS